MTPDDFKAWLEAMRADGHVTSDAHAGRLLGVTPDTVVNYKTRGAPVAVGLACRWLLLQHAQNSVETP